MDPASQESGQPHFHIARHNIACNARPPSLPPSFFPSSARLLVRSFVACFLWPLYSPLQLTVCSVLLPDRTEATEEGRGECKQRPRRGRGSKVLHNNTAACYTSFFTLRRGRGGGGRTTRTRTCELRAVWPRFSEGRRNRRKGTYEEGGRGMSRLRRRLKARSYICMKQPCPAVTQLLNSALDGRRTAAMRSLALGAPGPLRSLPSPSPSLLPLTVSSRSELIMATAARLQRAADRRDEDVASVDE